MADYDIRKVFEDMELELIASMKRNLSRHQKWEKDEGINWTMWQAEQLKTLEEFKKTNNKLFKSKFSIVNSEIKAFLEEQYKTSGLDQEKKILEALYSGNTIEDVGEGLEGSFFNLNERKMNALIKATTNDMKKAENAMLRMVNDQYRKTIFKSQVMANSGAFTLKQSIDMASRDFLKSGINCIQYKDGRRVNIASYSEMALRTANTRAMLVSEGDAREAYGIHTVKISKYGRCSETCLPWQGRIYVDDVYSGGTKEEAKQLKLPLLSEAIAGGLFHPNCKHRSFTYFYDIKEALDEDDGEIENPPEEQEHRKNQLHIQQQKRLATGSLDPTNIATAKHRQEMWEEKDNELMAANLDYTTDEISWPEEGTPITKDEYKVFRDKINDMGYKVSGMKDFDGDTNLVLECLEKTQPIRKRYPEIFEGKKQPILSKVTFSIFIDNDTFAVTENHFITLNSKAFRSKDILKNEYKNIADSGWFVKGTDYKSILIHELGHIASDIYKIDSMSIAKKITGLDAMDTLAFLENNLSIYSASYDDGREIISEVFSDYFNNDNPQEFTLRFMEEFDKIVLKERSKQL